MASTLDQIENLGLLIALSVAASLFTRRHISQARYALIQGALLGAVAVVGMMDAMVLDLGVQFDGRSVAISLCGLQFGPGAALIAATMSGAWRILQGGAGVPMELAGIAAAATLGSLFYRWRDREAGPLTHLQLLAFGLVVHLVILLTTFLLPFTTALEVLPHVAPSLLLAFPLATVVVGRILAAEEGRQRFVDALSRSEALFRATLYSIGDAVVTTDRDGRVRHMNPVAEQLTGWTEAEARGRSLDEICVLVDEASRLPVDNPALRALREGSVVGLANRALLIALDGAEHPISDSGAVIRGIDGAVGGVVLVFRDRGVERAAEQALRYSEVRFARALEHIPDVVVIYDTELRIQYINEATRRVTGRPASDFLGRRDDEVWSPEVYEPYLPALQRALATGQTEALEIALDLPESGTRHLHITCIPLVDGTGRVCEVMGITQDFTEQYWAASALGEEERRFHTVFNQLFQFMVLLDPEGQIIEINDLPLRAGGVTRNEVVGQVFWDGVWWRDLPAMRANFPKRLEAACLAKSPVLSIDEYQLASGEVRLAETAITAVHDDSGSLQYYIVQASDITEKQRAREELVAANELMEGTFDSMTEAVLVIDYDQRIIVRSNAAVSRVFGYSQAELDGQNTSLLHIDSLHYRKFGSESEAFLASGKPYSVEYPMRRKDGTVFPTEITVRTIHVSRGWKMGVVSVIRDISLRKKAENALRESEALLRIAGHAARIGGWYVDVSEGRVIWSEEARAIHEAPPEELLSPKEAVATYAPGSRERVAAAFQKCAESGTPYDLELELITHRGRRTWVRVIGQAVRGAEGKIVRVQGALQDIDEQKQIESTLAESQQKFQQLADAMPLIVWTALPDGSLDFANRALALYTGRSPAEGADELWLESMHAEDRLRYQELGQSAIGSGLPFARELRLLSRDGTYRWHQIHAVPIRDGGGRVVKWYGTAADVHDSKLNEARLARTLESITDAFYMLDRFGRFTYLNPEAERLLQRNRGELLGREAVRVFPEMLNNEVSRHFLRALRENSTVEFETYYAPFKQWFEVHAYPSEEGLAVYFRDITERLEAEQEMRALSTRLQSILDFSPLFITELDVEGYYLLANSAVCEFLGRSQEDILGKHLRDVLSVEAAEQFQGRLASVQRMAKAIVVEDAFEIAGVKRHFSTMLFPLFNREGAVISVGGIAQEVSDRKRAEAEREKLEEQLRQVQKMDAIGRLAGGIAHDFNNMLGVILGFTDMAIEALPADHEAVRDLSQVRAAASHSAELTRQLLAFARKQATAPEVLNLNDAVGSILKMLGRLIGEDIALIWRPGLDLGPVRLDPTQLDQILANLAVNARDAIHGVGRVVIETEGVTLDALFCEQHPGFRPGRYVLLSVSDDGCGMTHETQTQIFEPFFTTKPLGSGTGLGLSTVYGIVKQNSGFINVYSEPGAGTTFRIYLPCLAAADKSDGGVQKPVQPRGGTETVLLVEDEVGLLELGRRLLERLGYVVIAANGSTQALAASTEYEGAIDLLVTDVIMPDMNGRDLWLRLQADRPGLKSLFMSGYTADVIAHQGALEEGVHFLQKPFTMDAFATKLREALK